VSESIEVIPPFIKRRRFTIHQPATRPTAREWARHTALFLLTALTATLAGATLAMTDFNPEPTLAAPVRLIDYILYPFVYYLLATGAVIAHAIAHPELVASGAMFAATLLAILVAHEAGHYVACRYYGVKATLPFFIPAPPLFLTGTFGAFIKIKSPIPSRRALFDIGVAGPLAGFAVILPVAVMALLTAQPAPIPDGQSFTFNDPLLFRLLARPLGVHLTNIEGNPFYYAAWFGLLVTSLNLLPVGQLDGGHATYAIFGAHLHKQLGRFAFAAICVLAPLGWLWHGIPSGFVYAVLLFVMLRVRHPSTQDVNGLGPARLLIAALTLGVFLLSFLPFPLTIN